MVRKGLRDPRFHSVRYRRSIFFFQAEDGIRDGTVTGVQTCALPISAPGKGVAAAAPAAPAASGHAHGAAAAPAAPKAAAPAAPAAPVVPKPAAPAAPVAPKAAAPAPRSEERRVGKEGGSRWSPGP